jgi:hypothetical protein
MGIKTVLGAGALILGATLAICAQEPAVAGSDSSAQVLLFSGGLTQAGVQSAARGEVVLGEIVREVDDPHTGDRWLLLRNDLVPGGPGRLMLVAATRNSSGSATLRMAGQSREAQFLPVIRTGDRLIVEEHTARVDAVLEARALNPAAPGSALNVRLLIGGNVVRAIALGPGRAALRSETGERP